MPSKINFVTEDVIFKEGEEGDAAYLLVSGEVWLFQGEGPLQSLLDVKNKGQVFGEMALYSDKPRFAAAIAKSDVSCIMVDKKEFKERLSKEEKDPITISLIKSVKEHGVKASEIT